MAADDDDVTVMKHVRPHAERSSPDEEVQRQIASGERTTERFNKRELRRQIREGDCFVPDGQKAQVAERRDLLHKIGSTGGDPETRVAEVAKDPAFLMAPAKIVASGRFAGVSRKKLERLLQRDFAAVNVDVGLRDQFGGEVKPAE